MRKKSHFSHNISKRMTIYNDNLLLIIFLKMEHNGSLDCLQIKLMKKVKPFLIRKSMVLNVKK